MRDIKSDHLSSAGYFSGHVHTVLSLAQNSFALQSFPPITLLCRFTQMSGPKPLCTYSAQGWISTVLSWTQRAPARTCMCI